MSLQIFPTPFQNLNLLELMPLNWKAQYINYLGEIKNKCDFAYLFENQLKHLQAIEKKEKEKDGMCRIKCTMSK
jgi:hypothetical protein